MSRRAQGKAEEEAAATVTSDLKGVFSLSDGVLRFSELSFTIPGAAIRLAGWYRSPARDDGLRRNAAHAGHDLRGCRGGVKGAILKVFDPSSGKKAPAACCPSR